MTQRHYCLKYDRPLGLERPRCADPSGYCKDRNACPVYYLQKTAERSARKPPG